MFKLPEDRLYSENHLWIKKKKKKLVRIGLTDYFSLKNLEIIEIDLPEEEEEFDLIMPVSGKIARVNEKVLEDIDILNEDPYDEGWLLEIELLNPSELEELLPPEDYEMKFLEEIEEIPEEKIVEEEE